VSCQFDFGFFRDVAAPIEGYVLLSFCLFWMEFDGTMSVLISDLIRRITTSAESCVVAAWFTF
jgi:pheromone shutdown protein TraB